MLGVAEEAQERAYAVMMGPASAKSAYTARYLRTLRTYLFSCVIFISAVITPETRQLLGPNVPIISGAIIGKSDSPSVRIDDEPAAFDTTHPAAARPHEPCAEHHGPAARGDGTDTVNRFLRSRELGPKIRLRRLIERGSSA